jgi:hypothetical protein
MRGKDWAGTVMVACLVGAAGLLHDHTLALVVLLATAAAGAVVIAWYVLRRPPKRPAGTLRVLTPPSIRVPRSTSAPRTFADRMRPRREAHPSPARARLHHDDARPLRPPVPQRGGSPCRRPRRYVQRGKRANPAAPGQIVGASCGSPVRRHEPRGGVCPRVLPVCIQSTPARITCPFLVRVNRQGVETHEGPGVVLHFKK